MMEMSALYLSTHNSRGSASYADSKSEKSDEKYGSVLLHNVIDGGCVQLTVKRNLAP